MSSSLNQLIPHFPREEQDRVVAEYTYSAVVITAPMVSNTSRYLHAHCTNTHQWVECVLLFEKNIALLTERVSIKNGLMDEDGVTPSPLLRSRSIYL